MLESLSMNARCKFPLNAMILAMFATFAAVGCDDGGTAEEPADAGPDAPPPDASPSCIEATQHSDFAWIQQNIFAKSCAFATSCHSANANASAHLSLTKDLAYAQLVGMPSTQETSKMRVVAGDCDASYLFHKVSNDGKI